jgi:hypothetical protein
MEQPEHADLRHRRDELTCYVPGCPNPRACPPERAPIPCPEHWQKFTRFRPEELSQVRHRRCSVIFAAVAATPTPTLARRSGKKSSVWVSTALPSRWSKASNMARCHPFSRYCSLSPTRVIVTTVTVVTQAVRPPSVRQKPSAASQNRASRWCLMGRSSSSPIDGLSACRVRTCPWSAPGAGF